MITRLSLESPASASSAPKAQKAGKTMTDLLSLHSLSPPGDHQLSSSSSTSSSSATNTDFDSLGHLGGMQREPRAAGAQLAKIVENNNNNNNNQQQPSRSPILIKYNYYDYNGARQEQTNQDMNFQQGQQQQQPERHRVHRQLSPTFKQSLDQIVRQQLVATSSSSRSSSSTSPSCSPEHLAANGPQLLHFARRYKLAQYEQRCLRCGKTVYQMDKVGPLKDFTFYHQNCFKCRECGTKLTLKTYFNNQQRSGDQEVYCHRHCPKSGPGRLDNQSVGIRCALNAPKVFEAHGASNPEQWAPQGEPTEVLGPQGEHHSPQVDARALYIQHAVQQTRLQNIYKQRAQQASSQQQQQHPEPRQQQRAQVDSKKLAQLISRRLEFLEPRQKLLEMRHREEEDQLFRAFELKWRQEESSISAQIKEEWQVELGKLLDKYRRQLSSISAAAAANQQRQQQAYPSPAEAAPRPGQQQQQAPPPPPPPPAASKQQMIELERLNLEKSMTIKLDRKKETLKRKLKEFERQATAELVEKQSREMLALISMKLAEYKEEQKHHQRKLGSDLDQFEAMDSLANQLGSSLQLQRQQPPALQHSRAQVLSMEAPAPAAPETSKMELYNHEEADEVFRDVDELAINVAREDQQSFTDLVHHLTRRCITDVEKCRAIFRWITVKNLNTMHFDQSVEPDTPLGLLRGIKNGSESYHVLFKRLCSYAGLHCVVIKGYSKSAGYQPGVRFEGNRFRNSWNAVYVAGAWRFVQCNWGARHLVSVAVMQDKNQTNGKQQQQHQAVPGRSHHHHHQHRNQHQQSPNHGRRGLAVGVPAPPLTSSPSPSGAQYEASLGSQGRAPSGRSADSLRYEYDDHYFLTDPDEFIYEFHPLQPEWQLLGTRPISLQEFEQLPFVRSLFFKYGLYFPQHDIRSVLHTDSSGATTIKIGMPTHMIPSLIFHYNLKYYDSDQEHYEGVSLKRFVMQSIESGASGDVSSPNHTLLSNIVSFRVHLPENGAYILDIFANSTTPSQYITGEPMKFKSVCKFKIVAKNLKTVMIPLPDCASGEYGPMKATRLFGIIPITHENGLIVVQNDKRFLEIQFRMTRPLLDFMASLHKNGYDERQLSKTIKIFIDGDIVIVTVKFFEDGQYGLDIYTRDHLNHHHPPISPTTTTGTDVMTNELATPGNQQVDAGYNDKPRKQLLTHCCKYLINVRTSNNQQR